VKRARGTKTRRTSKPAKRRTTRAKKPAGAAKRSRKSATRAGNTRRARQRPRAAIPEAAAIGGRWSRIGPHVTRALRAGGWANPDPEVVRTIAAVTAGYRQGPASDPFPTTFDGDGAVADAFIRFYSLGTRSPGPDRRSRQPIVRRTVTFNLRQLGIEASRTVRDTLAAIALGVWRPGLDEVARLNGLASFLVPWYRTGLA
jgi:hypothetical protein